MIGITEISKEVSKKTRVSEAEAKKTISSFLDSVRRGLVRGEDVSLKGYFTLKRSKKAPKMNKFCDKHTKSMDDFKRANKNKGLAAFVGSPAFRKLSLETKNCSSCKTQKQKIAKSTKLLTRVNCKVSGTF
jgi:nucleoid DNA-binding protein